MVLNAFDNRRAMSGVIEPRSLTIFDNVFLDIPNVSASSEMVSDKGSIYCLFNMPPGCVGGLFLVLIL